MGRCVVWDPFRNSHPDDVDDHVYVGGVPYPNNANIQIKTPRQDNLYIMTMMFSPVTAESSCEDRQSHRQAISHQAALVGPRSPPGLQICHNFSTDIHNQQAIPRCKKIYVNLTLFCLISLFTTWSGEIPQKCSQNSRLSITLSKNM